MVRRHAAPIVSVIVAIAALLALAVWLQQVRDRAFPKRPVDDDTLYLTSGPVLRRATVAFQSLAADVYWIRTIQYYGGARRALEAQPILPPEGIASPDLLDRYELLYPLLDLTTTLDPRFNIAYRFGAIFLAEPFPGGPGRPDLAIALLKKAVGEMPERWTYLQDIGFVYYWWAHDYEAAARWFERASEVPGAPWWLKSVAAYTLAEGGDRQSSRLMWTAIRQSADNDWLRNDADRRLAQLDALDRIDRLQATVDRYAERTFMKPSGWIPLVRAGVLPGVPVDPRGTPYDLVDGRVELARGSPLYPLPIGSATRVGTPR